VDDTRVEDKNEPRRRAVDLHVLAERYEVVGELRGSASTRYFFGRRRDDRGEVLISVIDGQAHGDNNALAHLASDSQILSAQSHPVVAHVIEGQWLASNEYVIVAERLNGSTLHELLSSHGAIAKPRIATLLQQVNAALTWARERGVVHRGVTAESMYIDPDSDRVHVVFSLTPIPLFGLPDAASDARTIGSLAWAMLAGQEHTADSPPLTDIAPNLSERVAVETTALATLANGAGAPDVEQFLSVVAMGDAIREGELEMAELQAGFMEQVRIESTKSEARAREIEAHAEELEEQLARERAEFEEYRKREESRLANIRQQFTTELAQLEQERSEFADRVAEFKLRTSIERPANPATVLPPLASEQAEAELVGGGSRFGWMVPVGTVALLLLLIVFGAVVARHRGPGQTVVFGRGRSGQEIALPQSNIPRGGFLSQSSGNVAATVTPPRIGSYAAHLRDSLARRDSIARHDSIAHHDSVARRDSIARRDSLRRRDTIPPDTLR